MAQVEARSRQNGRWRFSHPVLIATQAYPPLGGGSSTIMKNLLDPIDPGSVVLAVQKPTADKERVAPVSVHRRFFVERLTTLPGRLEQLRRYLWRPAVERRLTALARKKGCRAVVGVYPDLFFLDAACRAARRLGLPFVPYLHDTVMESTSGSRFEAYAAEVQDRIFSCARTLLVATRGMAELYREKYGLEAITVQHIYPEPVPERPDGDAGGRDLFWSGNIYAINVAALRRVFEASGRVNGVPFMVASAQGRENLERLGFGGERVRTTYIPVKERQKYLEFLKAHGVLVLALSWPDESPIHEDELRTIFPTKTPEYLGSGRPILVHCPEHYYLARFFREHGCGEVVSERNSGELEQRIRRLLNDREHGARLGQAALDAAREFRTEAVVPVFVDAVEGAMRRAREKSGKAVG